MKQKQFEHLIFFDSDCNLCKSSVKKIIQIDAEKIFCFAPLNGVTAQDFLKNEHQKLINSNSLVLVENFSKKSKKYWIRSKGFFRILWLIGGFYKTLGALCFLPAFLIDWVYSIVANHRHNFYKEQDHALFVTKEKDRFLP